MLVANNPMKRPSDGESEGSSSKRHRVASVASQDSDENGQNALGITFGEAEVTPSTSAPEKGPVLEIADSQEDANDKGEVAKPASDKPTPDRSRSSISSDDSKGGEVPQTPNDVKARLAGRFFTFNLREIKIIVRWMRMHRTYKVTSHKAQFNELARYLGYTHSSLSPEDQAGLRSKLRVKMASFHINMKKSGAITDEHDGYESAGSNVFLPLPFAEWTKMWYKKGWDGSLIKPDKAKYEAIMNEPDDEDELSSDEENGDDQERDAEKDTPPPAEAAIPTPAEGDAPAVVGNDGYDGLEIFVVEEEPQLPDGVEYPPPKEDDFPEAKAWNQYLLNKEIIDEHDWNYRVMVAQNLGLDLKELAVLYPDPFPGYEPPAREDSAPATTPTRTAASTVPSSPDAPYSQASTIIGTKEVRVFSRPQSDDSISIGSADSDDNEDEDVLQPEKQDYTEEKMGDDELEDEDKEKGEVDKDVEDKDEDSEQSEDDEEEEGENEEQGEDEDVPMENDNASQSSNANTINTIADTQAPSPEPRTPQHSVSRQSRTPRSLTPISYTAVWSPKDPKD
ncbi:hypothetical protein IFR05_006656 [Cadophora sp. M221]|nr:hypothetical protein IFR05_006656 [Cadophora sp. M221]